MRVRYLRRALADLDCPAEFIASGSPESAGRVVARITQAIDRMIEHPAMGRPGRVLGTRELVIPGTPYIVPYRVRHNSVEVLRIFHSSRRWPEKL